MRCDLGRLIGLDPGERRIGVAVTDPDAIIAQPHEVIDAAEGDPAVRIGELCRSYDVDYVVVGLPISLSGAEGPRARAAREFGTRLAAATGQTVVFWDERFTTATAEAVLREGGVGRAARRRSSDKVAAAVMLQSHLDRR